MHPCLRIPEIVDLIFEELDAMPEDLSFNRPYSDRVDRSRDFAALATTCKILKDPALAFLWREQLTVSNVMKLLPSHLWVETNGCSRYPQLVSPSQSYTVIADCNLASV